MAAPQGHESVLKLLLEGGTDPQAVGAGWCTALPLAALNRHESIVKLLIDKGADVNAVGNG